MQLVLPNPNFTRLQSQNARLRTKPNFPETDYPSLQYVPLSRSWGVKAIVLIFLIKLLVFQRNMGELPDGRGADLSNSTRIAGAVGNSLRNQ
jgi:hypothetical protein